MKSSSIVLSVAVILILNRSIIRADAPTPLRDLGEPKRTQVVATLDTKIEDGKNAVWCASFVAAWKHLQTDLAHGPLELDGVRDLARSLNTAADPTNDMPDGAIYAAAGRGRDGIVETIRRAIAAQFPSATQPSLPETRPEDFVAYARIQLAPRFPLPYFDLKGPMKWTDGAGNKMEIRGFGIEEKGAPQSLRKQVSVLYENFKSRYTTDLQYSGVTEWAVDLNDPSQPVQVIIAQIPRERTLAQTIEKIEKLIDAGNPKDSPRDSLGPWDMLRVPEMLWSVNHAYQELEGRRIVSGPLKDDVLGMARQDIEFRLNRFGAELKSEAIIYGFGGGPMVYEVSRPFLVMLKQRSAAQPFLVIWVENDELLHGIQSEKGTK